MLTVKSIRELADDFDKRSGALMADGRRTLGDISRAVTNFDRNPTRVLFGASNSGNSQAAEPPPRPGPTPAAAASPPRPGPTPAAANAQDRKRP
jgi:phospholipid/cholesterol/gamma-HCH transport system substrate-binding protein